MGVCDEEAALRQKYDDINPTLPGATQTPFEWKLQRKKRMMLPATATQPEQGKTAFQW